MKIPRVLLAGTRSGGGKTTLTAALLCALKDRGLSPASFKCGPDYIDPMFHEAVLGVKSSNLDLYFLDPKMLRALLAKNSKGAGISVIEGVMGYYDGLGLNTDEASSYAVAKATKTPVILIVDAKGASLSLLAEIEGFLDFVPDSLIGGVILNRCSEKVYKALRGEIQSRFSGRVKPLGYFPYLKEASFSSRHLGLIQVGEVAGIEEKIALLGRTALRTLDIDGILELAGEAEQLAPGEIDARPLGYARIAVSKDPAFGFYYRDNLDLLKELGAEIVFFSPIADRALPEDIDGLYLGGGYPELHLKALSENETLLSQIRERVYAGLPTIAECGGFMYLLDSVDGARMIGAIEGEASDTGKLSRFGYVELVSNEDGMLFKKGERVPAHEFHYYDTTNNGESMTAFKKDERSWSCVHQSGTLYAGFPHFHFHADAGRAARRFVEACMKERKKRERNTKTK